MDRFVAWLENEMRSRELGINQLGKLSGVSPSHISNILAGKRKPSPGIINKLAKYFKADPDYLLELAGYRQPITPEKTFTKIKDQELRYWLDAEKINSLSEKSRNLIRIIIQSEWEEREASK